MTKVYSRESMRTSDGPTSLAGVAICQSVLRMIQVSHVLDPSRNQGKHEQQAVQTCHQ